MSEIKVGSRVRSFDFPSDCGKFGFSLEGERAAYVEGFVLSIGWKETDNGSFNAYEIGVYKDVFGGKERFGKYSRKGTRTFAPVNGTRKLFGGETNGVVLVEDNDYEAELEEAA